MIKQKAYHKTDKAIKDEVWLIKKAQKNPKDFAPLYDLYYLQIFKYVIKRVKDENDAAEITSDIFAKALFNIGKFKFKGLPFSSWLYRIASNEITNFYRKNQSSKYVRVTEEQLNYLVDNAADAINIKSEKEEKFSQIITSLEVLSDDDLELIEMRFFEERSFKEIAEILNLTEGNARIKTHRAITKLKNNI
ncbi:MAG: sigma-70 family RNA polymerase sigma factor [Flavobacteriales bacterium]|nr:sigma-70 family RNA polymerase sigma factor [Flavobacteriales bacterium]